MVLVVLVMVFVVLGVCPVGFLVITRSLTMEIERNLVQMIRTGPPEVLGRFWAGFRRIWRGFRAIHSYAPPGPIYIYIYIYIHTHIYIYIYIYICMWERFSSFAIPPGITPSPGGNTAHETFSVVLLDFEGNRPDLPRPAEKHPKKGS